MADYTPSGNQYEISRGHQHAVVVEVGGGVREYRVGTRNVLDPYPVDAMCDGAHGAPLIPWPNRLADGKYSFDGNDYQVALTEPKSATAIHGFLRWRNWSVVAHEQSRVVMGHVLRPLQGYPFSLDVRVAYELDDDGLRVTTSATNTGVTDAPWACGAHPYLSPGEGLIDSASLLFTAGLRIATDERQLPKADVPVAGTDYDFSTPRPIGPLKIDFAFKEVARDEAGRARVRLTGFDGRCAELWCDASYRLVELYTGDTLAPNRQRHGLGVEPMSAPPNAFATGHGVIRLAPGESTVHVWGARLV
ncbi:MAG: aldose 1-epimerase family protein [Acidothermaceae bacterium]